MFKKVTMMMALFSLVLATGLNGETGIKGGLNFGDLKFDPDAGYNDSLKTLTGFRVGLFFTSSLSSQMNIQTEAYYVQKGAKISETVEGITGEIKSQLTYIEVPLLLKLNIPANGGFSPFIFGGGYGAYLLSAKTVAKVSGGGESATQEDDIKDEIKKFDYGLTFGAGVELGSGMTRLIFEARYTLGLANIAEADYEISGVKVKNTGFSVMAGLSF